MIQETAIADSLAESCLRVLRTALASEEFGPSLHAAEALTMHGRGGEAYAAFVERLSLENELWRRCALARELIRTGDRSLLPMLWEALEIADVRVNVVAAEALFKLHECGDGRTLRRIVADASGDTVLRLMAAGAFAFADRNVGLECVREHLAGADPQGRKIAAWIVAQIGDDADVAQLRRNAEQDQDPMSQAHVLAALACHHGVAGRRLLGGLLVADSAPVRAIASEFLGRSGAVEWLESLTAMLADPDLDVRVRAAQSILSLTAG